MTLSKEQVKEILLYCRPHLDKMWAASIVSMLLDCDFRDAKEKAETTLNTMDKENSND